MITVGSSCIILGIIITLIIIMMFITTEAIFYIRYALSIHPNSLEAKILLLRSIVATGNIDNIQLEVSEVNLLLSNSIDMSRVSLTSQAAVYHRIASLLLQVS